MRENESKNSILILGACGFIGTNLSIRLSETYGDSVVCFDRPGADWTNINKLGVKTVQGDFADLADPSAAEGILSGVDTVYHLVSTTCPTNSNLNIAEEFEENVITSIRFLDSCVRYGVRKVVFLSSGGTVYGREHNGVLSEEDEANPISSYGIQKLTIEKLLYLYHEIHGLDYRIVRLANPYGPYQRPNGVQGAVSTFTWKVLHDEPVNIYGDGTVVRDYIYIDDAIDGILNIASDRAHFRTYNLGSGNGISLNGVTRAIAEALGREVKVSFTPGRKVDVPVNILDITRYRSDFGETGTIPLSEGIKKLADFYENNL